jgi:formate dehydrogenase major subunit
VAGLARSFGSGAMTNSIPDIEESDCILITGSNTSEAHPLVASRVFKAKERGAKVIVIEPRLIQMAYHADVYLRQRPGTDVAWINGMMNVILANGWENKEFIAARTEGFEALKEKVKEYPPERVEQITGIPGADLARAAEMYAKSGKSAILYCMGITQHISGVDNVLSCANLAMLTGNIGRRGTGVNPLRGQNNVQGACDMGGLPNVYTAYQNVTDEAARKKFEDAWGVKLHPQNGITLMEMIHGAEEGKIKGMFILGENPLLSDPDIKHVKEALGKLEFLAVEEIFPSDTTALAHVVLPGASWAEKNGTFSNTERRVQLIRKAVEPPGEARADWEIIRDIGKKMSLKGFDFKSAEEIFNEMAKLTPSYAGISYGRLSKNGGLQWPCRTPEDPGTEVLHTASFSRGKGLFSAIDFREPAELPDKEYPFTLTTGRSVFHYHTGTVTRNAPTLENELHEAYLEVNPEDAGSIGVSADDFVKVASRRGEIKLKVRVTDRIGKGVVFMPFHFAEAAANALTNTALDPVAKIPEYKVCAVKVEKA